MELDDRLLEFGDRQQITDVIYRYCRAMDRSDVDLFRTVFWEDGGFGPGTPSALARDFAEPVIAAMKLKYEATQHFIGNILIDLRGSAAFVETYANVYHRSFPTPEGNESVLGKSWLKSGDIDPNISHDLTIGVRYVDRFEKRSGTWRIALRDLIFDWSQVQPSNARHFGSFSAASLRGERGMHDFSYRRDSR